MEASESNVLAGRKWAFRMSYSHHLSVDSSSGAPIGSEVRGSAIFATFFYGNFAEALTDQTLRPSLSALHLLQLTVRVLRPEEPIESGKPKRFTLTQRPHIA